MVRGLKAIDKLSYWDHNTECIILKRPCTMYLLLLKIKVIHL